MLWHGMNAMAWNVRRFTDSYYPFGIFKFSDGYLYWWIISLQWYQSHAFRASALA
jgi:hypothetical protein